MFTEEKMGVISKDLRSLARFNIFGNLSSWERTKKLQVRGKKSFIPKLHTSYCELEDGAVFSLKRNVVSDKTVIPKKYPTYFREKQLNSRNY